MQGIADIQKIRPVCLHITVRTGYFAPDAKQSGQFLRKHHVQIQQSLRTRIQNRQDVKLFLYRIILLYKSSYGSIVMVDAVFAKPETDHRTGKDLQV